jgi:hypothetical protein
MTRRKTTLIPLLLLAVCLVPRQGLASIEPSSMSLGLGYFQDLGMHHSEEFTPIIPTLTAAWNLSSSLTLRSSVSYFEVTRQGGAVNLALSSSGNPRDFYSVESSSLNRSNQYLPVSVGLRLYAKHEEGQGRGIFVEASPTAYLARFSGDSYQRTEILGGLQTGAGVRFAGLGRTRNEIGMNYYYAEAGGAGRRISSVALYMSIGIGD